LNLSFLCARKRSTGEELVKNIRKTTPDAKIELLDLDLASLESVKKCAADFHAKINRLDILFLNAGVSASAPALTKEGYEWQFGINHMGHALLTQLLLPKMLQTKQQDPKADLRIVVVSSVGAHVFAPKEGLALDQVHESSPFAHGMIRYGHSKLANLLFARKLAQLYPQITSTSLHPGTVKSEIWGRVDGMKMMARLLAPVVWLTGVTTAEGAKTQLWCATAPAGKDGLESGKFYEPIGVLKPRSMHAESQELTDELWEWTTEELVKHGGPGWPSAS
jgi:NAD(P)-dependent dehydrogenase (short-subunit alcohol dehydrogenase family)